MVSGHEQPHFANPSPIDTEYEYIQRRADQGVNNVFGGELEVYGDGRSQSPNHPMVYPEAPREAKITTHRKPRGRSYPQEDEPGFREPTYVERTSEDRAKAASEIATLRVVARAGTIMRTAETDPADLIRQRAIQRAHDERRGR